MLSPLESEALLLSIKVATWAVACSLPFAVAAAWLLARYRFPGKSLIDGIIHLPLVLPPVVVGYLLLVAFGRQGLVGGWLHDLFGITLVFSWRGAAVAAGVMAFPLTVRAIRLAFESRDQTLEAAARTLGAGPWDTFFTVTLPLAAPGVVTGIILGYARCLGEFGATITFASNVPGATRTLPLAIYSVLQTPSGEVQALRLALVSIAVAIAALAASEILARRVAKQVGLQDRA